MLTMQEAFDEAKRLNEGRTVCVAVERWFNEAIPREHTECRISVFTILGGCVQYTGANFDACLAQFKASLSWAGQPLPTNDEAGIRETNKNG